MGHLVEAIKKIDQKRAAARPKPVGRAAKVEHVAKVEHAAKVWRIDEPHRVAAAHHIGELLAAVADRAVTSGQAVEMPLANPPESAASPAPKLLAPAPAAVSSAPKEVIDATPDSRPSDSGVEPPASDVGWRFPAPAVSGGYMALAARLLEQPSRSEHPQTLLLTSASSAALDAVSLVTLAAALSAHGNVLLVDTRNLRPMPVAVRAAQGKNVGWHELRAGKTTWQAIITPTSLAGVSFVGCGARGLEANGQEFDGQMFEPLRGDFSFVLIGGGLVKESAALGLVCSITGLVVGIGRERRCQVDRALRTLSAAGVSPPVMIAIES